MRGFCVFCVSRGRYRFSVGMRGEGFGIERLKRIWFDLLFIDGDPSLVCCCLLVDDGIEVIP